MGILPNAELASIRADFATVVFDMTGDILRVGSAWDAQGGNSSGYSVHQSGVPCAVIAQSVSQIFSENQEVGKAVFLLIFPAGTDIKTNDRVHIGSVYYDVINAFDPSTLEIVRKVTAQRFGKGAN